MDLLCKVCDKDINENKNEYKDYIASLHKKDDKSIYKKDVINIINLGEFDKVLSFYISHHNKKFNIYFFKCDFQIELDNNFIAHIEIDYHHNNDTRNIKSYLLFYIDSCELAGNKFKNINQMTINTVSDRRNMKYEYYMHPPMFPLETELNIIIGKYPQLLDQNINHLLIRKYSHISFII